MLQLGFVQADDIVVLTEYQDGQFDGAITLLSDYTSTVMRPPDPLEVDTGSVSVKQGETGMPTGSQNIEYQKRMDKLREQQKKVEEEKQRIAQQVE